MRRINVVLILSLLMNSCGQNDLTTNGETKSRGKRELREEQVEVKKTAEEALKEKLNDEEKANLDFLKEALGDNSKFDQFVLLNESKIKNALEHIKTQLESCKNNNDGQNGFKAVVQGYFNTMDESKLNGFKDGATSTCQAGASS